MGVCVCVWGSRQGGGEGGGGERDTLGFSFDHIYKEGEGIIFNQKKKMFEFHAMCTLYIEYIIIWGVT